MHREDTEGITKHHLDGEIIAADNSTDRMHEVARGCAPVAAAGTGVSRSVAGAGDSMKILVVQESDWVRERSHRNHRLVERLSGKGHEVR